MPRRAPKPRGSEEEAEVDVEAQASAVVQATEAALAEDQVAGFEDGDAIDVEASEGR